NTVLAEPSPQLTTTCQGPPTGSAKEPRSMVAVRPSMAAWLAAAVTTGALLSGAACWKPGVAGAASMPSVSQGMKVTGPVPVTALPLGVATRGLEGLAGPLMLPHQLPVASRETLESFWRPAVVLPEIWF